MIIVACILFNFYMTAQVKIGSTGSVNSALMLEVDNSTNQGVLLPKVELGTSLTDTNAPIKSPTEGLLVYNEGKTGDQKEGLYIWKEASWRLMADNNNMVNDLVLRNESLNKSILNTSIGSFTNLNDFSVSVFSNNISDSSIDTNNYIHLPKGNYFVQVVIDYLANNITASNQISGTNGINLMKFLGSYIIQQLLNNLEIQRPLVLH